MLASIFWYEENRYTFFDSSASSLDEIIYIEQELDFMHRDWQRDLSRNGRTLVTYHMTEFLELVKNDETHYTVQPCIIKRPCIHKRVSVRKCSSML